MADRIVTEPLGGAQRDRAKTISAVGHAIEDSLRAFEGMKPEELRADRRRKFVEIGSVALS